jgi:hypothetical protein
VQAVASHKHKHTYLAEGSGRVVLAGDAPVELGEDDLE